MTTKMDLGKGKAVFKKKAHRPWQPTLLENAGVDEIQSILDPTAKLQDKNIEFLQKQLETTLDIKRKESEELNVSLSALDTNRITLGGFLKPKNILFAPGQETLHKTASIIHELKAKEQEILDITQHLKLTQAEEQAERAEMARLSEERARQVAEEKAFYALRQAQ